MQVWCNHCGDDINLRSIRLLAVILIFPLRRLRCSNELFKWNAATGELIADVTPAPPQPLCVTAVDPSTSPAYQVRMCASLKCYIIHLRVNIFAESYTSVPTE